MSVIGKQLKFAKSEKLNQSLAVELHETHEENKLRKINPRPYSSHNRYRQTSNISRTKS